MSRSGYSDDVEQWALICWRGAVASALRGKRGQAFLREMLAALDAMPEKKLIADDLEKDGAVCAIGAVGKVRGLDMSDIDPEDHERIANQFGISHALACEIMWENDDGGGGFYQESQNQDERRYWRMHRWIEDQLIEWDGVKS